MTCVDVDMALSYCRRMQGGCGQPPVVSTKATTAGTAGAKTIRQDLNTKSQPIIREDNYEPDTCIKKYIFIP
jgi:hypothetical protein